MLLIATSCGADPAAPVGSASSAEATHVARPQAPTEQVVPAPGETPERAGEAVAPSAPFELAWQRASGAMFRDQISISSTGRLVWVAQVVTGHTGAMRTLALDLDEAEVRSVRAAIAASDFFALPAQPAPSPIADGTQLTLRIRLGDRQHQARLEEALPPGAQRIVAAVDALLDEPRRAQLAAAPEAPAGALDPSLAR